MVLACGGGEAGIRLRIYLIRLKGRNEDYGFF